MIIDGLLDAVLNNNHKYRILWVIINVPKREVKLSPIGAETTVIPTIGKEERD